MGTVSGESTAARPWSVIRQDDNGNRYHVGRYATRSEAEKVVSSLDGSGHRQIYWVEQVGQNPDGTRN
ncbi:SPOR domain-containing protein [Streptomyces sp. J2-1]|uniref:SPOR domain-containing protein n=1 Tax=Streptomyces corallincola TaxID=2851888 RepID=UPI001C38EDBD|nr:SPOR domain-containing protein [Streptomyces corallincola]MBV2353064.1 SPOR domain-containing protein [Streptomyces corallincola]